MKKVLIAVTILFLFSFCEKNVGNQPIQATACAAYVDWTGFGIPGFQGNCYLATNAQIRWMQQNGYLPNVSLAPDNNNVPTKSQIQSYCNDGSTWTPAPEYNALSSSSCAPIGWLYQTA